MSSEEKVRAQIEKGVDGILENPVKYNALAEEILITYGIEPSLSDVLSFTIGQLRMLTVSAATEDYEKILEKVDPIITRRIHEIREAIIRARYA